MLPVQQGESAAVSSFIQGYAHKASATEQKLIMPITSQTLMSRIISETFYPQYTKELNKG